MLKKQVIIQKGLNIFTENPIILLFHFNNVSTKNWQFIKNEIKKRKEIKTQVIQNKIANEILKRIQLKNKLKKENQIISVQKKDLYLKESIQFYLTSINCQTMLDKPNPSINPLNEVSTRIGTTNNINQLEKEEHPLKALFQGPTFILGCKTRDQLVFIYNLLKTIPDFVFVGGLYGNQNISHHSIQKIVQLDDSVKSELIQFLEYKKSSIFLLNSHVVYSCSCFLQLLKTSLENGPNSEIKFN